MLTFLVGVLDAPNSKRKIQAESMMEAISIFQMNFITPEMNGMLIQVVCYGEVIVQDDKEFIVC